MQYNNDRYMYFIWFIQGCIWTIGYSNQQRITVSFEWQSDNLEQLFVPVEMVVKKIKTTEFDEFRMISECLKVEKGIYEKKKKNPEDGHETLLANIRLGVYKLFFYFVSEYC